MNTMTITARGYTHAVVDMDGRIISRHRSESTAQAAIDRERRAFRRSPYSSGGAYLPRSIIALDRDGVAHITRSGQYSTSWCEA